MRRVAVLRDLARGSEMLAGQKLRKTRATDDIADENSENPVGGDAGVEDRTET